MRQNYDPDVWERQDQRRGTGLVLTAGVVLCAIAGLGIWAIYNAHKALAAMTWL